MSWLELVDGSDAVRATFGTTVPTLARVRLHEVVLHQDGPTVSLRLDFAEYPAQPPSKWLQQGHNTVQVVLSLDGCRGFRLDGWSLNNVGRLSIKRAGAEGVDVEFSDSGCQLNATCDSVRVAKITAYHSTAVAPSPAEG